MKIGDKWFQSIWHDENDPEFIFIIDQRFLPHELKIVKLRTIQEVTEAIREMMVRGAPLIGVTAAWGVYLALIEARDDSTAKINFDSSILKLTQSRPTAINLNWAVSRMLVEINKFTSLEEKISSAFSLARKITEEDIETCKKIGLAGLPLIESIAETKNGSPVNIMTHCNAGWLACVDYGTALSPIYLAQEKGIDVHIWISETRPRNQGALTAWELSQQGIPGTVFVDNASGYLLQNKMIDLVIVGADRVSSQGDLANKVGTYMKALAAKENGIPFYAAFPQSTIDLNISDGTKEIPIEFREEEEVLFVKGMREKKLSQVEIFHEGAGAINPGFDVTPFNLVTGFITDNGVQLKNSKGNFLLH